MKKPALILALFLFAACAVVGYLVASKSSIGSSNDNSGPANAATALASPQQNYLLIQVNDLSQPSQKLIQVWMVLTYYSDPPQIIFLPLYPSYDSSQNTAIGNSFALTSSGSLSNNLPKKITEQYKVQVDGYILTDAKGVNAIANWFGIKGIQAVTTAAKSDVDMHAILLNSQSLFQNVCKQLKAGDGLNEYASIQWSQLIPSHFQTNLTFEQLITSWDRVIRSTPPQQCEVLSKE